MFQSQIARIPLLLLALGLAWGGLALQFHLSFPNVIFPNVAAREAGHALLSFVSTLIILANLLMALALSVTLLAGRRFPSPSLMTGLAVAIVLIAVSHPYVPAKLWSPQNLQWRADMLLHNVVPAVFVLFWILFVPKGRLHWGAPFLWLAWPILYVGWAVFGSRITGLAPHPSGNSTALVFDAVWIGTVFLLAGLFAAILDKILGPLRTEESA